MSTETMTAEALERLLVEQVPCAAPRCPEAAVVRGTQHHTAHLPLVCEAAVVCADHQALVDQRDRDVVERCQRKGKPVLCGIHGWPVEHHTRWVPL